MNLAEKIWRAVEPNVKQLVELGKKPDEIWKLATIKNRRLVDMLECLYEVDWNLAHDIELYIDDQILQLELERLETA